MKKTALFFLVLVFAASAFGQAAPATFDLSDYGVRVEPDKRLMLVLMTLEMARYSNESGQEVKLINTPLSESGSRFRQQLESDLSALPSDLRQKIGLFVSQYKKRHPKSTDAEIVSPFMSMAYTLSPVPELADPIITSDLPGSLLDVLDFAPLVREFYRRSGVSAKLDDYTKEYQRNSDLKLRGSAREMVSELLDYLHTRPQTLYSEKVKTQTQKSGSKKTTLQQTEVREHERRFYIVPELLAPAGDITFLNVRDDYFVIVPPETDLAVSDARRAFLQFVTDSLVLSNSKDVSTVKDGIKQLLDEQRKSNPNVSPDVYLAVSRSLAAAADARQMEHEKVTIATGQARLKIDRAKTPDEKKAVSAELDRFKRAVEDDTALMLSEEYEKGSVLAFYFADQLKGLEDSGFDVASSMREMLLSFDPTKETGRLAAAAEARKRALTAREERRKNPEIRQSIAENPVTTKLLEIQKYIDAKNYPKANSDLKSLLAANPSDARIYYNLARVASLSAETIADPEQQNRTLIEAKQNYDKVVELAGRQRIDPTLLSLTYVALAKIYEFYDNNGYAIQLYDKAIAIGPLNGGAYSEAMAGKQRLIKNQ
jgi:tetratricopeptide (TPR) repeat protein